nr:cold shock domain-containing protein [Sansalvadorimonas sp. 2012CJ34-2]
MPAAYSTGSIPSLLILLAAGGANLMSGCYLTVFSGARRTLQGLGSIFLLAAGIASAFNAAGFLPVSPHAEGLPFITVATLVAGLVIHALSNLHRLSPGHTAIEDDGSRECGTVKWFNVSKGFGFITRDHGGDIFVHYRAIRGEGHRTLSEGQRVEFQVANKEKGLQAEDVVAARR